MRAQHTESAHMRAIHLAATEDVGAGGADACLRKLLRCNGTYFQRRPQVVQDLTRREKHLRLDVHL